MKRMTLEEAVSLVKNGDTVAFGGNVLYRSPISAVKEIIRQNIKDIHIIKTAIAYEADLLCAAGSVRLITAGFVGYEGEFGMCRHYRREVEAGRVLADENACYSVITSWRAASYGVPFLPIRGLIGSDLIDDVGFKIVSCPYTGEELVTVKAIAPDIAFLHVQKADWEGNCSIVGPVYEDKLIASASKKVIVIAEEIVDGEEFKEDPHRVDIPAPLVTGVVCLPGGARPCAVSGYYDFDRMELQNFLSSRNPEEALNLIGLRTENKR